MNATPSIHTLLRERESARSSRPGRTAASVTFSSLALAIGLLLAGAVRADVARGTVTKCGNPATNLTAEAFVNVSEGFPGGLKPCTIITSTERVGEDSVDAQGRYSITFTRPERDPDACSFSLKSAFVELHDAATHALVWRSSTKTFTGANTTFVFDHALDCPPPPPPGGDPMTVSGHILFCGQPAAGFTITAVTEVRLGFDLSDTGGKPCVLSEPKHAVRGTTTIGSDGSFSIRFDRPINPTPEDTCSFQAKVFIKIFDPSTGGLVWFSSPKSVATNVVFDEDICRFFVAVSVKVILNSSGHRPSGGYFSTDAQIERAISQANLALAQNGVGWRLFLDEIVDVEQPQFFRLDGVALRNLEKNAMASPDAFLWRTDAVNIYVVDSLSDEGHSVGGICSFPTGHPVNEIIAVSNRGILNDGVGWLHEVGHFLSLTHTFECLGADCDKSECTGTGALHSATGIINCPDNCPHDKNIMSYNPFDLTDAVFSACQIREMAFELFDPAGTRTAVLRRVLPTGIALPRIATELPSFLRGDSNSSGAVDISDALNTLGVLLLGTGAIGCPDAADSNDDGHVDISDAVATLSFLFLGSDPIAPPGARTCSPDGTDDALGPCQYSDSNCPRSNGES